MQLETPLDSISSSNVKAVTGFLGQSTSGARLRPPSVAKDGQSEKRNKMNGAIEFREDGPSAVLQPGHTSNLRVSSACA